MGISAGTVELHSDEGRKTLRDSMEDPVVTEAGELGLSPISFCAKEARYVAAR